MLESFGVFFLSWLLPGSGHLLLGKRWKGLVFFLSIVAMIALGVAMKGKLFGTSPMHPLILLGLLGDLGQGIFFGLLHLLGLAAGDVHAVTHHYGTTFLTVAGLLNFLVALQAFDLNQERRRSPRAEQETP